MKHLFGALWCWLVTNHRFEVVAYPPQIITVIGRLNGTISDRGVPGFLRRKTCVRCGHTEHQIIFTPGRGVTHEPQTSRLLN